MLIVNEVCSHIGINGDKNVLKVQSSPDEYDDLLSVYAVEDRTPRVYPWMNEPGDGILVG